MIKINGVIVEGSVGTTYCSKEVEDWTMDGGFMGTHLEVLYMDFNKGSYEKICDYQAKVEYEFDATGEVAYDFWKRFYRERTIKEELEKNHRIVDKIEKGKKVIVVKGEKVPLMTKGVVFWMKEERYGYGRYVTRIGIKDEDGNVYWTYAYNVQVYEPDYNDEEIIKSLDEKMKKKYLEF